MVRARAIFIARGDTRRSLKITIFWRKFRKIKRALSFTHFFDSRWDAILPDDFKCEVSR